MGSSAVTQHVWDDRAAKVGLRWLEPVQNAKTPALVQCDTCERTWSAHPSSISAGHGCDRCAPEDARMSLPAGVG